MPIGRTSRLAGIVLAATLSQSASAQGLLWSITGSPTLYGIGKTKTIACIGDLDGDGLSEIATRIALDATVGGSSIRITKSSDPNTALHVMGPGGNVISRAGDLDQDGFGDLLSSGQGGGSVRVWSGNTGLQLFEVIGPASTEENGVSAAGDFDGNGTLDFAVGLPGASPPRVRIHSGTDGALLKEFTTTDVGFGTRVCDLGDIDGDGFVDVGVVAASDKRFNVLHGGTMAMVPHTILSDASNVYMLAGLDDVDGDGTNDLAVSNYNHVRILATGSYTVFQSLGLTDNNGREMAAIGDHDGDGRLDLLTYSTFIAARLRSWNPTTGAKLLDIDSEASFGAALAGAGDFDGDGLEDVLIGAPDHQSPFGFAGVYSLSKLDCGTAAHSGLSCASAGTTKISISMNGCIAPGGFADLQLSPTAAITAPLSFFILVGTQSATIAMPGTGCNLLVDPNGAALLGPIALPSTGFGTVALPVLVPDALATPLNLRLQMILTKASPSTIYFTNALQITMP